MLHAFSPCFKVIEACEDNTDVLVFEADYEEGFLSLSYLLPDNNLLAGCMRVRPNPSTDAMRDYVPSGNDVFGDLDIDLVSLHVFVIPHDLLNCYALILLLNLSRRL